MSKLPLALTAELAQAIIPGGGVVGLLVRAISAQIKSADQASDADIPALREETQRQELKMRIAEAQARVAQELAIAMRIENAVEVEIEEFYDMAGEGNVGAKSDGNSVSLGAAAGGHRVSKRVYKFRGAPTSSTALASQD